MSNLSKHQRLEYTESEWYAEGRRRFGDDMKQWRFVCPCCGHIAKAGDWIDAGAERMAAFSCIGRVAGAKREAFGTGEGPCNYAGGGLFGLNPVKVTHPDGSSNSYFAFAEAA